MSVKLMVGGRVSGLCSLAFRFVNVVGSDLVCDRMNAMHVYMCI